MKNRNKLLGSLFAHRVAFLLLAGTFVSQGVETSNARQPNFVVIMADDLGAKELSCYGHPQHQTPALDSLAKTGVKFETCYAASVCHPTRFMIMTGQYGCHNGVLNFPSKRGGPAPDAPEEQIVNHITFAKLLKDAGYATAVCGKWQLSGRQPNLILETGFDEYCMWGQRKHFTPEDVERVKAARIGFRSRYWHPSIIRNGKWHPTRRNEYGPNVFTDFAIDFMKRKKDQPFFIYYPMCLTHGPLLTTPDSSKGPEDRRIRNGENFPANVSYMDKLVGHIVGALEGHGLRENTIVFFTGDNGTGGDGKSTATELGARVPMIVNCPELVKARGATNELTDLSDIVPTLVELAGAKLPKDRPIDGKSYAKFLQGKTDETRDWIFSFQADRRVLRTKRWLLEDNSPLHYGQLFDCGDSRNGSGYREVTDSKHPEVVAAKQRFDQLLGKLPAPHIPYEGRPNSPKRKAGSRVGDARQPK